MNVLSEIRSLMETFMQWDTKENSGKQAGVVLRNMWTGMKPWKYWEQSSVKEEKSYLHEKTKCLGQTAGSKILKNPL